MNKQTSWRDVPERPTADEIKAVYEADVVVAGLGYSGVATVRAAAEAGLNVIAIEKMPDERYNTLGAQVGHINSEFLRAQGVAPVDPIEFFNEMMLRGGNRANPRLIMKFSKNCGEAFDWFIEPLTTAQREQLYVLYHPQGKRFTGQIAGQKFWVGSVMFPFMDFAGDFQLTDVCRMNLKIAQKHGADIRFGVEALQLEKNDGRVTAIIARGEEGLIRIAAKKAVVLATGDFGSNEEMCKDLLEDISDLFEDGERFASMSGRDGSGIRMGVWAGGKLEPRPMPTMGGNYDTPVSVIGNHGTLWLNEKGLRYCNEGFGDPVMAGFPGAREKRGPKTVLFDSNVLDALQAGAPAHTAFFINDEKTENQLKEQMTAAVAAGAEGYLVPGPARSRLYAADTVEELADRLGFTGEAKENFVQSVAQYNEYCETGRDEDFGKDKSLLSPIKTAPLFAEKINLSRIGMMLCSLGGLMTDGFQNVLDENKEPIPGLYATGNCCGRRWGTHYSTPIAGVSIAMALTLGRVLGRELAD